MSTLRAGEGALVVAMCNCGRIRATAYREPNANDAGREQRVRSTAGIARRLVAAVALLLLSVAALASPGGPAIAPADLAARMNAPNPPLVVDVRTPAEFRSGHLAGALNIPHDQVESRWASTHSERDDEVILYCGTGRRAGLAQQTLETMGYYHTRLLEGGIDAWKKANLPVVTEEMAKAPSASAD